MLLKTKGKICKPLDNGPEHLYGAAVPLALKIKETKEEES